MRWEALEALPARGDWPRGATSDDTEQLLLVAEYLVEANGQVDERDFLGRLANALPGMRGAGPTTQAAVRRFVATGELHATDGSSIGAAMRALPFGWATPVTAAGHRRELTIRLSRTTHGAPEAIISACVVAEMAAWAIEQHPVNAVIAAGLREAEELAQKHALDPATLQPLRQATNGDWPPNTAEPTLDALATVASVLHVLREANGLATAMKRAVALGEIPIRLRPSSEGSLAANSKMSEARFPGCPVLACLMQGQIEATAAGLCELRRTSH